MHKKIISATAAMMAAAMLFTGCASQEIQDRKAAAEAAAIAAAQPTPTPAPTPEPTPEPIDAWSLLDNLPDFAVGLKCESVLKMRILQDFFMHLERNC